MPYYTYHIQWTNIRWWGKSQASYKVWKTRGKLGGSLTNYWLTPDWLGKLDPSLIGYLMYRMSMHNIRFSTYGTYTTQMVHAYFDWYISFWTELHWGSYENDASADFTVIRADWTWVACKYRAWVALSSVQKWIIRPHRGIFSVASISIWRHIYFKVRSTIRRRRRKRQGKWKRSSGGIIISTWGARNKQGLAW